MNLVDFTGFWWCAALRLLSFSTSTIIHYFKEHDGLETAATSNMNRESNISEKYIMAKSVIFEHIRFSSYYLQSCFKQNSV
jgi:hypothetical protein